MLDALSARRTKGAIPVTLVTADKVETWAARQPDRVRDWLKSSGFKAGPGSLCLVPDDAGGLARVVVGIHEPAGLWDLSALPTQLPPGRYTLDARLSAERAGLAALGWALGAYRFERYKSSPKKKIGN